MPHWCWIITLISQLLMFIDQQSSSSTDCIWVGQNMRKQIYSVMKTEVMSLILTFLHKLFMLESLLICLNYNSNVKNVGKNSSIVMEKGLQTLNAGCCLTSRKTSYSVWEAITFSHMDWLGFFSFYKLISHLRMLTFAFIVVVLSLIIWKFLPKSDKICKEANIFPCDV